MELSPDTQNVLDYLESSSEGGLRKRNDLGTLFELTAQHDAHQEMNDLLFYGSHLYKLYHTLRRAGSQAEGYAHLEQEFKDALERVRDLIARTLVDAEAEQITRFETTYYAMTQGSLRNLVDLAHDLNVAKSIQNENKFKTQK